MFIYGHVSAYPAWSVRKSGRPRVSAIFDLLILFPQPAFLLFFPFLANVFFLARGNFFGGCNCCIAAVATVATSFACQVQMH